MSKKNDRELVLDAHYKGRARHFLDNIIIPLIKKNVKDERNNDTFSEPLDYTIQSVLSYKCTLPN